MILGGYQVPARLKNFVGLVRRLNRMSLLATGSFVKITKGTSGLCNDKPRRDRTCQNLTKVPNQGLPPCPGTQHRPSKKIEMSNYEYPAGEGEVAFKSQRMSQRFE